VPWSVRVAAAELALVVAVLLALLALLAGRGQADWPASLAAVGGLALLLAGVLRGWRLAFLWGRFLGYFLAALVTASAWSQWRHGAAPALLAVPLLGLAVPLLVAAVALGRPGAPAWFGLSCPGCGAGAARTADLLFRRARCRRCGAEHEEPSGRR
jgi:hypothetical protein